MTTKFKLIKSKAFEVKGAKHTHYIVALQGRAFSVSTLRFEPNDLVINKDIVTINCDIEVLKGSYTDSFGNIQSSLDIVPKCNLSLASF